MTTAPLPPPRHPVGTFLFRSIGAETPQNASIPRPIIRTTRPHRPLRAFSVSLGPLSPTQPNHGRFGTDVKSESNQRFRAKPEGRGFERAALRRGEPGSNSSVLVRTGACNTPPLSPDRNGRAREQREWIRPVSSNRVFQAAQQTSRIGVVVGTCHPSGATGPVVPQAHRNADGQSLDVRCWPLSEQPLSRQPIAPELP